MRSQNNNNNIDDDNKQRRLRENYEFTQYMAYTLIRKEKLMKIKKK